MKSVGATDMGTVMREIDTSIVDSKIWRIIVMSSLSVAPKRPTPLVVLNNNMTLAHENY